MPPSPLPAWLEAPLQEPALAVTSTVRDDGSASAVPCWYAYEAGRVILSMSSSAERFRDLRRDPRVSLAILISAACPYRHVSLRGRAVQFRDDPGLEDLDRISQRYLGETFPDRDATPTTVVVEVDHWSTYGFSER